MEEPPNPAPPNILERLLARFGLRSRYYSQQGPYVIASQVVGSVVAFLFNLCFTWLCVLAYGEGDPAKEQYGKYSLMVVLFATLLPFSLPGANQALVRSTARGFHGSYLQILRARFIGALVGSLAMAGCGFYFYWTGRQDVGLAAWICALIFPFHNVGDSWSAYLSGRQQQKRVSIGAIVYTFMRPLGLLVFLFTNNIVAVIVCMFLPQAICRIIYTRRIVSEVPPDSPRDPGVVRYGTELTLISLISILQGQLYGLVLGFLYGSMSILGIFHLSFSVARQVIGVWKTICTMALPRFAQQTPQESVRRMMRVLRTFYPINIAAVGAAIFLIPPILRFCLHSSYHDTIFYAQLLLIPACLFTPVETLYTLYVIAHDDKKTFLKLQIVGGVAQVVSLPLLVWMCNTPGILYAHILGDTATFFVVVFDLIKLNRAARK